LTKKRKFCLLIIELKIAVSCELARAHVFVLLYLSFFKVGKCQMLIIRVSMRDAFLSFFFQGVEGGKIKQAEIRRLERERERKKSEKSKSIIINEI
jgi:hypothetical protein